MLGVYIDLNLKRSFKFNLFIKRNDKCLCCFVLQDEIWDEVGFSIMVDRNWRIDDSFQDEVLVMNFQFVLFFIIKYVMFDLGIIRKGNRCKLFFILKYVMFDLQIIYKGL